MDLFLFSEDYSFILFGLIGFGIFFVLGNLLYYVHFFAGGDANLMIALGAVLPVFNSFQYNLKVVGFFFLFFFLIGLLYLLLSIIYLGLKDFKKLKKEIKIQYKENRKMFFLLLFLSLLVLILSFFEKYFLSLGITLFLFSYLFIYVKSVEVLMVKKVPSKNLEEGDWLLEDLNLKGKKIKSSWDGLTKSEISLIQKYKKEVMLRIGIPFAPVFLISYILLLITILL